MALSTRRDSGAGGSTKRSPADTREGAKLQAALYRIADMASAAADMSELHVLES